MRSYEGYAPAPTVSTGALQKKKRAASSEGMRRNDERSSYAGRTEPGRCDRHDAIALRRHSPQK